MLIISFTVRDHVFWPFNSNIHRISDLPDSILSHILSFLPTKFVATTSILSKRWKPVWLYVLILNFDDKAFNPNLVKVRINYDMDNLITLVSKANILHISQIYGVTWKTLPMFPNLTHMELDSIHSSLRERRECRSMLEILPHFPKLQHFKIWFIFYNFPGAMDICSECLMVPPNSTIAPECLLSQLKSFSIKGYTGRECEFKFVKYILQHSKVLETMTIKSTCLEKKQMIMKLSSCTRSSTTCKLLFG
ncbi:putative F-box/LRR-repeat protein At5g02930 isoform X1 [Vicia villosa]|uniref:putative F-box/LRR-repeat protein At5g02930 isoform X1 n=1 Tax=Vicia villosa TaxID=3911 RepID=UPI00273B7F92|nr:putative F-box/LRR-repeat protein At5g02930 isoform X1 [Vicia villosa]